ncbi:hypothetical protein EVAR_25358_1 [Eumeta japonica]|uniref:Uncharacterized protein n=1 Tax=Eumeta variegata TaxID=151549 RepID=A0A4C1XZH1_EUMVA|nr:hypothetical protein EVAR_25358_1 [Eumeta japonica]
MPFNTLRTLCFNSYKHINPSRERFASSNQHRQSPTVLAADRVRVVYKNIYGGKDKRLGVGRDQSGCLTARTGSRRGGRQPGPRARRAMVTSWETAKRNGLQRLFRTAEPARSAFNMTLTSLAESRCPRPAGRAVVRRSSSIH